MKSNNGYTTVNPAYSEGRKMFKCALVFVGFLALLAML